MGNEVGLVRVGPSWQLLLWILCIEALAGGALLHPSSGSKAEGVAERQGDGSRNGTPIGIMHRRCLNDGPPALVCHSLQRFTSRMRLGNDDGSVCLPRDAIGSRISVSSVDWYSTAKTAKRTSRALGQHSGSTQSSGRL